MSAQAPDTETDAGHASTDDTGNASTDGTRKTSHSGTDAAGTDSEDGDRILDADLLPSFGSDGAAADVVVRIYVVTGRHGILTVPESFCRECHMFARRADAAAEQVDLDVDVRIFSWWTRFPGALRYGGYHPPVMVVGGTRLCQGHDVPTTDEVVAAVEAAAGE